MSSPWVEVDKGLFVGEFNAPGMLIATKPRITIIKIDPSYFDFHLLSTSEKKHDPLTTAQWCQKYNLLGAINAGMYQIDLKTHAGYMKNFSHVNNPSLNAYHSVLAFNPIDDCLASIRLFDLDETEWKEIFQSYHTVIQNLRLIKNPGENRWEPQSKRWNEAALGQDTDGNILFIYSASSLTMHQLNSLLLQLPINLGSAQHLEGGPPASLYFSHQGITLLRNAAIKNQDLSTAAKEGIPIPNVIGFTKRSAQ